MLTSRSNTSRPRSFTPTALLGSDFSCDEPVTIRLRFEVRKPTVSPVLTFSLQNLDGTLVLFSDVRDSDDGVDERLGVGLHTFEITIPPRLLAPTTYLLTISAVHCNSRAGSNTGRPVVNSRFATFRVV